MGLVWDVAQREVLSAKEQRLLILGAAGTGKTTLVPHVAKALLGKGKRALVLTPSRKDAQVLGQAVESVLGRQAKDVEIYDFPTFAAAVYRRGGIEFFFADERDRQQILRECFRKLQISEKTTSPQLVSLQINRWKRNGQTPESLEKQKLDRWEKTALRIYRHYQTMLKKAHLSDVEDLYLGKEIYALLKKEKPYSVVICDDYQEVTPAQHGALMTIAKRADYTRLFCDPFQGTGELVALPADEFATIEMQTCFRLSKGLLGALKGLAADAQDRGYLLSTESHSSGSVEVLAVGDEHEEAWTVARKIQQLARRGKKYRQMAVYFRNPAQAKCFQEAFTQLKIPHQIVIPTPFSEEKEVRDMLSFVRVLKNPYDVLALKRVLNLPARGIGSSAVKKIEQECAEKKVPFLKLLSDPNLLKEFSASVQERLQLLSDSFGSLQKLERSSAKVFEQVAKFLGLRWGEDGELTLSALSRTYEESRSARSLSEALFSLYSLHPFDYYLRDQDRVALLHLGVAKTAVFDVVFIAGMEEGIFPQRSAILDENELERERRLCYTAASRARESAYFLYARDRNLYGGSQRTGVSRFLREMGLLNESRGLEENGKTKKKSGNGEALEVGARVFHKMWGEGEIVGKEKQGEETVLHIEFATVGPKSLVSKYAPLEPVS